MQLLEKTKVSDWRRSNPRVSETQISDEKDKDKPYIISISKASQRNNQKSIPLNTSFLSNTPPNLLSLIFSSHLTIHFISFEFINHFSLQGDGQLHSCFDLTGGAGKVLAVRRDFSLVFESLALFKREIWIKKLTKKRDWSKVHLQ